MKNKVIKFCTNPIFQLGSSIFLSLIFFINLLLIVHYNPDAPDSVDFIIGCRFGFFLFAFLFTIFIVSVKLIELGIWIHKRKVDSNGFTNSKD